MPKKKLSYALSKSSNFIVVAEFASGLKYNFRPLESFFSVTKEAGPDTIPKGFDFVKITIPQNPGGVASLEPLDVFSRITEINLLGD
ncbi:hypothetical protein ACFLZ8_06305 [Planctomycetota bacterium]